MRKIGLAAAALAAGLSLATASEAEQGSGVKVGVLTCNVSSGWGVIFGSTRDLRCVYHAVNGRTEHYLGRISKYGVDIGYTKAGVMVWAVFAPTQDLEPGALTGTYGGATAGAAVAVGGNVNVLAGGLRDSIALQPLSLEGETGLNVAAGVAELHLRHG